MNEAELREVLGEPGELVRQKIADRLNPLTRQFVERSPFVPEPDVAPPIPDWKRMTWAQEYLPEHDPARNAEPL